MAAIDLTTLANVKQWLNIQTTTDDLLLTRLITASSGFIQAWLNRSLISQQYVETVNGDDTLKRSFANYPVTAVTSVYIDGQAIAPAPVATAPNVARSGYAFDATMLYLLSYAFNRGFLNVVIAYTAGYTVIPAEIEQACIQLIGLRYNERSRIGQVSKSLGGEVVAFSQKDMSADILTILNNYKKVWY